VLLDVASHLVHHASFPGATGRDGLPELQVAAGLHPLLVTLPDRTGTTPLHAACAHGHTEAAEALLAAGADPAARDAAGENAADVDRTGVLARLAAVV
jgi:hypothetical protein